MMAEIFTASMKKTIGYAVLTLVMILVLGLAAKV